MNNHLLTDAKDAAKQKNWSLAEKRLHQLFEQEPEHLGGILLLGYIRYFQGAYKECEELNRRALAIEPKSAYAHKGLGMALAKQGLLEEGIAALEQAIDAAPNSGDNYWDLAVVLKNAGRVEDCRQVAESGAKADPKMAWKFKNFIVKLDST